MRSMLLAALLCACGPVAGVTDAGPPADAAEASAPLDAPGDALAEAAAPEAAGPDAATCPDRDMDGHRDRACGGDDCDDSNARVYPEPFRAPLCDLSLPDSNCDGVPDSMQAAQRTAGCAVEYRTISGGMMTGGNTAAICFAETRDTLVCAVCRDSEPRCTCWVSGQTSTRSCPRPM